MCVWVFVFLLSWRSANLQLPLFHSVLLHEWFSRVSIDLEFPQWEFDYLCEIVCVCMCVCPSHHDESHKIMITLLPCFPHHNPTPPTYPSPSSPTLCCIKIQLVLLVLLHGQGMHAPCSSCFFVFGFCFDGGWTASQTGLGGHTHVVSPCLSPSGEMCWWFLLWLWSPAGRLLSFGLVPFSFW